MAMQVELFFRLQEQPDDLDLATAFSKSPDAVKNILCEAICQVALSSSEFNLLRIANAFQSALRKPCSGYKPLRPILEACRQKRYGHDTERIFHQHAQDEGVVALGFVLKHQAQLINEIDALPEEQSIRLANLIKSIPKKQALFDFVKSKSKRSPVRGPPPIFARPRDRIKSKKLAVAPPTKDSQSPSPHPAKLETQDIVHERKRRKLCSTPEKQTQIGTDPKLPIPCEDGLSPSPTQPVSPNSQSHTRLTDHAARSSNISTSQHPDAEQQLSSHQEEQWTLTEEQFTPQMMDDRWDFGQSFIIGRPPLYPQNIQMAGQEGQFTLPDVEWDVGEAFIRGRPPLYPQNIQMAGQEEQFTL